MTDRRRARVALVAINFPPVRGGSAVVYANLARSAAGEILVVAARRSYLDGLPMIGWREHDRRQPYRVIRLDLLRTTIKDGKPGGLAGLSFLVGDIVIRLRLVAVLLWLVAARGVRAVCVGELEASGWMVRLFAYLPGVRTVTYVHGEEVTTTDAYDPNHVRARRALLASDCIVAVSGFTGRALTRLLGEGHVRRIGLIESGVDGTRFTPKPRAADLVEMYGLGDRFVFVSVCRLLEKKGVDNALRAFARVLPRAPDSRYLIVGTGPYRAELQALAASLGVSAAVIFAGKVPEDELVDHYRLGDVFVMPNRALSNGDTEGFGLVFLEANSCGLPVIAGRDGGSTDAVRDGENGLVVDGNSVDEIAEAMLRLREDVELRATLRRQSLATAAASDWAHTTASFLKLCDGSEPATAQHGRPRMQGSVERAGAPR